MSKEGLVLVNGPSDSVQGPRARALFGEWLGVRIVYKERGRIGSIASIARALAGFRGRWVYCIDLGIPGAPLAWLRRKIGPDVRLCYEIGDPARPLLANQGRSRLEVDIAHGFDQWLPARADGLVFRGAYLADYFEAASFPPLAKGGLGGVDSARPDARMMVRNENTRGPDGQCRPCPPRLTHPSQGGEIGSLEHILAPSLWLPDGVDTSLFRSRRDDLAVLELRRKHGLEGKFVVGFVGSLHVNPGHDFFSGWDLIEALSRIPRELPIVGVVVGDGPGRTMLEQSASDRLRLIGRVRHEEVPLWLNVFDVALSTQTDDPIGWGRTTAKLPEYLASGVAVVCTDVGEAHRCLRDTGQTLPYHGLRDAEYPTRLAERLQTLRTSDLEPLRAHNRELALDRFDYGVLRAKLAEFIGNLTAEGRPASDRRDK
jgi:glycosyltransferase involved in cell wall biosynthesis